MMVAFGRRYGSGWHSHVQRIMIGLSTASLSQMTAQGIWEVIARHTIPHTRAEYDHVLGLQGKLLNTNSAVYLLALIWWIVTLWIDEPGVAFESAIPAPPVPEYLETTETVEGSDS